MQSMAMSKQDKQTYDNVREFFKTDFERYRQLAELADLKGVSYDGIASKDNVNHQESKVITAVYCKNIVDTVKSIIERMHDERYKKFIKYRFFDHLSIWQISEKLQYSESTIKTVIARNSCLLFADMLAMVTDIDLRKDDYIENHKTNR